LGNRNQQERLHSVTNHIRYLNVISAMLQVQLTILKGQFTGMRASSAQDSASKQAVFAVLRSQGAVRASFG
jgi:hypothetical protein